MVIPAVGAATYADDGVLAISRTIAHTGRAGMGEFVAASLGRYAGTVKRRSAHFDREWARGAGRAGRGPPSGPAPRRSPDPARVT